MKNIKKLSTIVLSTLFASMQITMSADLVTPVNTGLGSDYAGGAVINSITGGYAGHSLDTNSATLNFDANSHVNWQSLNLNTNETLNFNAVNGANGLTILNTVNQNMSNIYGQINANNGISNLIISNPNGMFYNGAKFTTAGDVMLTTKDMTGVDVNNITNGTFTKLKSSDWLDTDGNNDLIQVKIQDSDFSVGGEFNIFAPKVFGTNSKIKTGDTLKLITANGSDYVLAGIDAPNEYKGVTFLRAMDIDGNVEVVNDVGALSISNGTKIKGDLKADVGGVGHIFGVDENNKLAMTGNVDLKGHGQELILRNTDVTGNVDMKNDGGFVEINNTNIGGNANLTTTGFQPVNHLKHNHYVHVIGDTHITGDLNIESSQNIHLGNYAVTQTSPTYAGDLLSGNLVVDGNLNAHTTGGHIMTTIDTTAKKINFNAEKYNDGVRDYGGNILSDDKAKLTADTYQFKSAGYIGGMKATNGHKIDDQVIDLMEKYTFIPADVESHDYMNINGGTITKIETPSSSAAGSDIQVYIKSANDLTLNGANASVVNLVAPDKKITITGDVTAKNINIGDRTGTLQLDFPGRNFTTNYTNIRDGQVVTIAPTEVITYELTNEPTNGYNSPDLKASIGTNTTYLVGPAVLNPPNIVNTDENARVLNTMNKDLTNDAIASNPINTPVAFAADLDDDEVYGPCRKNVDGSVTVVRAVPMIN